MKLSVIICTHNPREEFLHSTLEALKNQSLTIANWELILVDNASSPPLAQNWDLSWHPNSKIIIETELGLTPARFTGIENAKGELLVFVDDDNDLSADYLDKTIAISNEFPFIGVWGGSIVPNYEVEPEPWALPYVQGLAIYTVEKDVWSNLTIGAPSPAGAGMTIRREIAVEYMNNARTDPRRSSLGRKGTNLTSCEDRDMAYTACDLGFGIGLFTRLKLVHQIPKGRLELDYFLRLEEANGFSRVILDSFRSKDKRVWIPTRSRLRKIASFIKNLPIFANQKNRLKAKFALARERGQQRAAELLNGN